MHKFPLMVNRSGMKFSCRLWSGGPDIISIIKKRLPTWRSPTYRRHGIPEPPYCNLKSKYSSVVVPDHKRINEMEAALAIPNGVYADPVLDAIDVPKL